MNARVLAALVSLYFVWGSTFTAIKYALESHPPFFMAGARFIASGLILLAIGGVKGWRPLTRQQLLTAAGAGALSVTSNALVCWGELGMESGVAALFIAMIPVNLILLNWAAFERRRPSAPAAAGLVLAAGGFIVLASPSLASSSGLAGSLKYIVILVSSTLLWATSTLWQRSSDALRSAPFFQNIGLQTLSGGIATLAISFLLSEPVQPVAQWSLESVAALAYLGLMGTVFGYSAYVYVLSNTTPEITGTYALMNPIVALGLGVAFLGEGLSLSTVAASGLVLGGVALILFEKRLKSRFGRPAIAREPAFAAQTRLRS